MAAVGVQRCRRFDQDVAAPETGVPMARVRRVSAACVVIASTVFVAALVGPGPASAASSQVFSATGSAQSYAVPAGTASVHVVARGGSGGGVSGGLGATVEADVAVSPGDVLQINVGRAGTAGTGGWNGGGDPGAPAGDGVGQNFGGGGAIDIRAGACAAGLSCGLTDRVLVAGGGGGGDVPNADHGTPAGGAGGYPAGSAGGGGYGHGGAGGTASAGGAGGAAYASPGGAGASGDLGVGGAGGANSSDAATAAVCAGAGGGGGWYGGGGGGSDASGCSTGGAGGGGSSHVDAGTVSGASHATATSPGDGQVTITPASEAAPAAATGSASSVSGASAVLNAEVNPKGASTTVRFTYGRDAGLPSDTTTTVAAGGALTGSASVPVAVSISGLDPGSTYYFRATATSLAGVVWGDVSSFTTATAPARPDPPVAVPLADVGSVRVSWTAPADNGATITGYRVTGTPGSGGCETSSTAPTAAATSCVVSGLEGQAMYSFTLVAFSDAGGSPTSDASHPVKPGARSLPVRFVKPPRQVLARTRLRARVRVGAAAVGRVVVSVGERRLCKATVRAGRGTCSGVVHGAGATSLRAIFEGDGVDAGSTGGVIEQLGIPKLVITRVRGHLARCVPVVDLVGAAARGAAVTVWRKVPAGWARWTNASANRSGAWSARVWPGRERVVLRASSGGGQTPPVTVRVAASEGCHR